MLDPQQNQAYKQMQGGESQNSDGLDDSDGSGKNGKGKRRSKNDVDGRDFKCKFCDKTYLSYPALYTHIKQKHSKGPDGEIRNPPTSGRGRGRPRKNVIYSFFSFLLTCLLYSLTKELTQRVKSTSMLQKEKEGQLIHYQALTQSLKYFLEDLKNINLRMSIPFISTFLTFQVKDNITMKSNILRMKLKVNIMLKKMKSIQKVNQIHFIK